MPRYETEESKRDYEAVLEVIVSMGQTPEGVTEHKLESELRLWNPRLSRMLWRLYKDCKIYGSWYIGEGKFKPTFIIRPTKKALLLAHKNQGPDKQPEVTENTYIYRCTRCKEPLAPDYEGSTCEGGCA